MDLSFKELFEQQVDFNFLEGNNIEVEVISITNKHVIVDFGFKSEGYIDIEEFKNFSGELSIKIGDKIQVVLESIDDGEGTSVLSYKKAIQENAREEVIKSSKEDYYIEVIGKKIVNKGFVADFYGMEVFIPLSLIDIKTKNNYDFLINEKFKVKIIKYDFDKNSIFASRKHYIEKELGINFEDEFAKLKVGSKVTGSVKTFVKYGAFIDLGFMDSLLHLNDISWRNVKHASEVLEVNQELDLVVSNIDSEKKRVSVSLKDFDTAPWENFLNNNKVDDMINVEISDIYKNGIVVSYDNSIDFFIHYTDLSWYSIKDKIEEYFSKGQNIDVKINEIRHESKEVKLNYRDNVKNPLIEFTKEHKEGEVFEVTVVNVGDKFLKVEVESGVQGYIFGEEMSWNFDSYKELNKYKIGDTLKAELKYIEFSNHVLKFSVKNLIENPFLSFIDKKKGSEIEVTVISSEKQFLIVETYNGARTLVKNNSNKDFVSGDKLVVKIKNSSESSLDLML
tara:strand:- start:1912 stop:3432 length:1521 start_codon:yes stop_codon:yes gene_type:complete